MKSVKEVLRKLIFVVLLSLLSCNDNSVNPEIGQWENLGLEGKSVTELKLFDNYLYACAGNYGLYRLDLSQSNSEWIYLGFADSTLSYGITSLVRATETNDLIVGLLNDDVQSNVGIFRSSDNGLSWIPSDSGIRTEESTSSTQIYSLYVHPSSENVIYACLYSGIYTSIYKSIDYGITWKRVFGTSGLLGLETLSASKTKPNEIWAGGSTGRFAPYILHSTDEGESWESIDFHFYGDNTVFDIAIDPTNGDIIYLGLVGMVKTVDKGKSFETIFEPEDLHWRISINPANPQELFTTGEYLYWTKDGGKSWQKINPPFYNIRALAINWQHKILYVSEFSRENNNYGIYKMRF